MQNGQYFCSFMEFIIYKTCINTTSTKSYQKYRTILSSQTTYELDANIKQWKETNKIPIRDQLLKL